MFSISKEFYFSASHVLGGMAPNHPCGRMHGHNYVVIVELSGDGLDDRGMVLDYGDLASVGRFVDDFLDHRHLNDVMEDNPTAENLARFIYQSLAGEAYHGLISSIGVKETAKTLAVYRP